MRHGDAPCERTRIAGIEALVGRPDCGIGPVVLYLNACTPLGIEQPEVGRLLGGFARAGFVAIAPELPKVKEGEVTPATVDALVAVAQACDRRVTLIGASTGAGLAIIAAADPRLAARVSAVAAIAPFASLRNLLQLGTTGWYLDRPFAASSLVARATTRSLAAVAPGDPAVAALLDNTDPALFDALYAALAPETRALVEELSPLAQVADVAVPVELVTSPSDRFFPVDEARALQRAGRNVRLTVTDGLEHVRPRLRPGLVRVLRALDRTLRRASLEPDLDLQPRLAA
jgi:alpha-beta hydrolase superfamily lysophospholipase